jgi:phosphoenolpyruvate synthase/pyruvate phosphate dikinase
MDMEWGVDERTNKIWLLQARPETVWSKKNKEKKEAAAKRVLSRRTAESLSKACRPARAALLAKPMSSSIRRRSKNSKTVKSWLRP